MSEYWVSHKRYLCKYCNIYIADDKPSRQQHENGLRHQGNVERFVRGLYKEGEKRVREREEEKGIMASVGKAAEAAYALDVAAGRGGSGVGSASRNTTAVPKPKPKMGKPSDPYANYSTPASLGYTDPNGETTRERMHAGTPGAWTVVEKSTEDKKRKAEDEEEKEGGGEREEGEEGEGEKRFKVRRKTVAVGLGEVYDPAQVRPEAEEAEPSLFRKRKVRPRTK